MKFKKKKVRRINKFYIFLFGFALIAEIITSLFVGTINIKLQYELEDKQARVKELKEENSKLKLTISSLSTKERILTIATSEGLSLNEDNLISLRSIE